MRSAKVDLRIWVEDDSTGEQARQLYRWLGRDARLTRQATIQPAAGKPKSGQMSGASLDLINLILSNSIALGSLVTSIAAFCTSLRSPARPEPVVVVLRDGQPSVHVTGTSNVAQVVATLQAEPGTDTCTEEVSADGHAG
jgi:Effector Associated Constant Component 1